MKEVTKYIADDGREFENKDACMSYEDDMQIILKRVNKYKDNPSEALITLMIEFQDTLGKTLVSFYGYVDIFSNHKPCAYCCSLWRKFNDYSHDYPYIYALYREYMEKYIALYGEP